MVENFYKLVGTNISKSWSTEVNFMHYKIQKLQYTVTKLNDKKKTLSSVQAVNYTQDWNLMTENVRGKERKTRY